MLFRSLALAGVAALTIACSGDTTDTTDTTDNTDTTDEAKTTPTSPTGPTGPDYFDATRFSIGAEVGFDGTAQAVVQNSNGYDLQPMVYVNIALASWDGSFSSPDVCQFIFLLTDGSFRSEVVGDSRLYWGVNWDSKKNPVIDTCEQLEYELNPDPWSKKLVQAMKEQAHFAAVGDRTKTIDTALNKNKGFENYVGGQLSTPFSPFQVGDTVYPALDDVFVVAFEIDAKNQFVVDGDNNLVEVPGGDIWDGAAMSPGYYWIRYLNGWVWN